ncbi:hypothetical protein [Polyangium sp. 15x6]|uniref:hypothetical protein n=1 Tax=Polyangium sp. 15x6 TaxID=3042687 RepID=UPI00249B0507|nr:hypothetical protein [Polyangium sp. 15x6]MDI3290943.1 hypothetical protein [Polyangium sp. 15x6]
MKNDTDESASGTNRWALGAAMGIVLFTGAGCTVGIPLDANMRIDVDSPSGGKYSQHGKPLDQGDMTDKLQQEPANGDRISRAKERAIFGGLLMGIGSGCASWLAGQYIVTNRFEPYHTGFAIGAAVSFGIAIPLLISSSGNIAEAVDVHNKLVDEREMLLQEREQEIEKAKWAPLPEGFGFDFKEGPEKAASSCQNAGHQWTEKDGTFLCSGVPSFELKRASAELSFADGKISRLRILVHPQDDSRSWAGAMDTTETVLKRMYGEPKSRSFTFPAECAGKDFMACVTDGRVKGQASWTKKKAKRSVTMAIVNDAPPMLVVDITRVPPAAASPAP